MKTTHRGFTLIELLTVIAIISLLLSLAMPALNEARMRARVVVEKASLEAIDNAVENFANDTGYYPPSERRAPMGIGGPAGTTPDDQGAQRLVEAMFGLDFIGYQPKSYYAVADGLFSSLGIEDGTPIDWNQQATKRYGPYLERDSVEIDQMSKLHLGSTNYGGSNINSNSVFVDRLDVSESRPILYYAANAAKKTLPTIYDYYDNIDITQDDVSGAPMYETFDNDTDIWEFYGFIWDPLTGYDISSGTYDKTLSSARPSNADSFILINAGRDHKYGTEDDITNFK